MKRTAFILLAWLIASLVALCWNATFWLGLGSLALCIIVGHKHYENGGHNSEGVC